MINKIGLLTIVVLISIIIASLYGYVHNQFTYSISSEYFTKFKFDQFIFYDGAFTNNDAGKAHFIGVLSTWWFGALIGLILGTITIFFSNFANKMKIVFKAIILTLCIAIIFGLIGLVVGKLFINDMAMDEKFISSLDDSKAFVTAGSIHNFSYLGGLVGLGVSAFYLFKLRKASVQQRV